MATSSQFRCAVEGLEALAQLREAPLPAGLSARPAEKTFHRDIYLETSDRALARRGAICRLRMQADDRRFLSLIVSGAGDRPPERWDAEVAELDARRALEGATEPARRLRGLVDPSLLKPRTEIETERWTRLATSGWLRRVVRFAFLYDACTVRHGGLARNFEELQVRRLAPGGPHLDQVAQALERMHGIRPLLLSKSERAARLVEAMASEATARMLSSQRAVALVAFNEARGGGIAFISGTDGLTLPVARGSGEEATRHLLRHIFSTGVAELTFLGHTGATDDRPEIEVWAARKIRGGGDGPTPYDLEWLTLPDALARAGTPELRAPETLGALAVAARANLTPDTGSHLIAHGRVTPPTRPSGQAAPPRPPRPATHAKTDAPPDHFLNVELSQLAFQERVLELAEDDTVPLAERLRYLAIVSGNLDEFFSVRVGALKTAIASGSTKRTFDGLSPAEQFDAIAARVPSLMERHGRAAGDCLSAAAEKGIRVCRWDQLNVESHRALVRYFDDELLPLLTPRAVTLSPGHPFPIMPHLTLAFAVLLRDVHTGPIHFAYLAIPSRVDRFIAIPDGTGLIPIEEVVRANLQAFYPDRPVEQAWLFRVTRGADLDVNEEEAGDLLQAIEEEVSRRPLNAPMRVEVERGTPLIIRELLLRELRFERRGVAVPLGDSDVYEIDGWLDLTCLRDLAGRLSPADQYPPVPSERPFPEDRSLFDLIDEGELLVHHPFDDFGATVARFVEEAARDPQVMAIKVTLYRVGDRSPVVDALAEAAKQGKDVAAFVELKARFDEARNARWVKRLEAAQAQVIYGLVGLKTHAKLLLIVRQTKAGLRRYAHIGTGNYNQATARVYTDLGLFTADPAITADVVDLFNQLTGSSRAPVGSFRRLLVSPGTAVAGFVERIDREIGHVKAGRGGRIRIQVNGLEDPDIVSALYRASEAGVEIDLIVRGLCVLRPGVPGLSDRIQVRSVLGRFLEHQRIFHFGNGGDDDYLIGSADLRPRNLRRRVEVVTPVQRRELQARLSRILDLMIAEPSAWELDADGRYTRGEPSAHAVPHVHSQLLGAAPKQDGS